MSRMTGLNALQTALDAAVKEHGLTGAARVLGVPVGQIRSVISGRSATAATIVGLADALGLEFYVGPPRASQKPAKTAPFSPVSPVDEVRRTPVSDRRLAELLARLADDWEAGDEFRRGEIAGVVAQLRLRGGVRLAGLSSGSGGA